MDTESRITIEAALPYSGHRVRDRGPGSPDDDPPPTPRLSVRGLRGAVVGPIDLALDAGRCLTITGSSGAGKSVMLRMIADLDPGEGEAALDGRARSLFAASEWRRRVTYVAAEAGWWMDDVHAHFTAWPAALAGALGVPDAIRGRSVAACSTGERQRLALMRALAVDPAVLLLDEPTASLDAGNTARVEAVLEQRMRAGLSLLLATHDPAQAERLGQERRIMADGRLLPPP